MQEFKVNKYITLKLEEGKTVIYIQNREFMICKRLFLQIPGDSAFEFDEIDSIDEAEEVYKKNIMYGQIYEGIHDNKPLKVDLKIIPEEEFWGHCSNIQVWVENDYDTRMLHSNIAFPLLEKLSNIGDPKAKNVFKEELAIRFSSGYIPTVRYLILKGFLYYFNREELRQLFFNEKDELKAFMKSFFEPIPANGIEELSILKVLANLGEAKAIRIIKKEVSLRISDEDIPTIKYLILQGYLYFFSREELRQLFYNENNVLKEFIISILKSVQPHEKQLLKILKILFIAGDPLAKKRFSEIMAKNIDDSIFWAFEGGIDGPILDNFTYDELHPVFFEEDDNLRQFMQKTLQEKKWFNKAAAFPILKKLAEIGDHVAKAKLIEEITTKFLGNNIQIVRDLVNEGYLEIFSQKELNNLIFDEKKQLKSFLYNLIQSSDFDMNLAFHILENVKDDYLIVKKLIEDEVREHLEAYNHKFILNLIKSEFIEYFTKEELLSIFFNEDWSFKEFMVQSLQEEDMYNSYAFPLLKELPKIDIAVKNILKEVIKERFEKGSLTDCFFLLKEHYLDYVMNDYNAEIELKPRILQFRALGKLQKLVPYTISEDKHGEGGAPFFGYRLDGKAENIEMLSMNSCRLKKVPDVFNNFASLKHLYLYDNQLTKIPESISKLTSLETLELNKNQIKIFPESISGLKSLKLLNLSNNLLRKFPNSLNYLRSLTWLMLDNNELNSFPMAIADLTSLETLSIQDNNLKELPESIRNLSSLEELLLNNNLFEKFPEEILTLPSLSRLNLDNNKLSTIPGTIINAESLKWLTLNDNQFANFPEVLTKLKKLRSLHMENNQLMTLPESIRDMHSLEEIVLRGNEFKTFPQILNELTIRNVRVYTEYPEHMKKKRDKPEQSEEFKNLLNRMKGTIDMLKDLKEKSERED